MSRSMRGHRRPYQCLRCDHDNPKHCGCEGDLPRGDAKRAASADAALRDADGRDDRRD